MHIGIHCVEGYAHFCTENHTKWLINCDDRPLLYENSHKYPREQIAVYLLHDALEDNMGDLAFFRLNDDQTKLALVKSNLENPKTHAVLDLQSDNIKKTYQLLKRRGVRVDDMVNPYWIYHEFHFYDLEGNKLKIHGFSNDSH